MIEKWAENNPGRVRTTNERIFNEEEKKHLKRKSTIPIASVVRFQFWNVRPNCAVVLCFLSDKILLNWIKFVVFAKRDHNQPQHRSTVVLPQSLWIFRSLNKSSRGIRRRLELCSLSLRHSVPCHSAPFSERCSHKTRLWIRCILGRSQKSTQRA